MGKLRKPVHLRFHVIPTIVMKTITTAFPEQKASRRVAKPIMEKRRRERINHSLETLRLMLWENTQNEKLKNPKVEKAEILESVVNFLKTEKEVEKEHYSMKRVLSTPEWSPCNQQHNYREGMRSCLLRVSHFITTKNQELEEASNDTGTSLVFPSNQMRHATPGQLHRALIATSAGDPTGLSEQHLPTQQQSPRQLSRPYVAPGLLSRSTKMTDLSYDTSKLLSPEPTMDTMDLVWRPWPQ
ncbi:hairy-related 5 [Polymixia lowei]